MRARRLVAAVAVATLGVLSLGACGKSAPDAAAYVGDTKYRVDRVDAIYDEARAKYTETIRAAAQQAGVTPSPDQLRWPMGRQDVLNLLVGIDLGKRVAAEKQIQVPDQITVQDLGQGLRVPDTEYAELAAEWYDLYQALEASLPPAELTDDARIAVYDALVKAGAVPTGWSADEVRTQFGAATFVRQVSAVSAALQDEADRLDTSINPRYRPVGVPALVQGERGLIQYALPYIDANGPVTDISTPEAPSPDAAAPDAS